MQHLAATPIHSQCLRRLSGPGVTTHKAPIYILGHVVDLKHAFIEIHCLSPGLLSLPASSQQLERPQKLVPHTVTRCDEPGRIHLAFEEFSTVERQQRLAQTCHL